MQHKQKAKKKKKKGGEYNGLLTHFICRVNYDREYVYLGLRPWIQV